MTESLELSAFFPVVTAERLYRAWLDSTEHAAFTGSPAQVEPQVGGRFTAWLHLWIHPATAAVSLDRASYNLQTIGGPGEN